jgi:hypothetical protein
VSDTRGKYADMDDDDDIFDDPDLWDQVTAMEQARLHLAAAMAGVQSAL